MTAKNRMGVPRSVNETIQQCGEKNVGSRSTEQPLYTSPARTIRPPFSAFFQETTCPAWNDAHIAPLSLACIAGSAWLALARKQSRERFR
jgi:hypothetical protein